MGSLISREGSESKTVSDIMDAIDCPRQENIEEAESSEVLPFDPRSPTLDFNRTPIQVAKVDACADKKSPDALKLVLDFDPRSPSTDILRSPIFIDPRSPTTKICRTPIEESKPVDWGMESEKLKNSGVGSQGSNSSTKKTPKINKHDIYEDEDIVFTPVPDHNSADVKPPKPKKLFDESRSKPLGNVTNKKGSANTPTQILQRRHGRNVQKAMKNGSVDAVNKENNVHILSH